MAADNSDTYPFHDVSVEKEKDYVDGNPNSGKATIRFHVEREPDRFDAYLNGTTLKVSVKINKTTYKEEVKDLEIKAVRKEEDVKFDGSNLDVKVYKRSQFSIKEKVDNRKKP